MLIEVSDLFDAFHQITKTIWSTGEFEYMVANSRDREQNKRDRKLNGIGLRFDELVDALENDFFFSGCARRAFKRTEVIIPIEEVRTMLRLHDVDGDELAGETRLYHSHGFDWPLEHGEENAIGNAVISDELWPPQYRPQVRLFLHIEQAVYAPLTP